MAADDDLNGPLGLSGTPHGLSRQVIPYHRIFFAAAGLLILGGGVFLEVRGDPFGGEPQAVAIITPPMPSQAASQALPSSRASNASTGTIAAPAGDDTATDIERRSGVKVVRNGGAAAPGALIIDVPQVLAQRLTPAPDPRLVETSRYGLLPRIGRDGARPADVYARPWPAGPMSHPHVPRIALVIGGSGLSAPATAEAIRDLPGPVTLAFAPYGNDLQGQVQQARAAGHEVILQLPMEPIDYPRANPGPHTLLATAALPINTANLHWLLSRFSGYTGVANFLGAKFTSATDHFRPVLREIAARGLFYVDDGASADSGSLALAKSVGLPAVRADLIIDASGQSDAIDANLVKLEAIARTKGIAIGMASDLPTSLEKIAGFTKMAEARGILFIPLSAAVRAAANVPDKDAQDAGPFHDP